MSIFSGDISLKKQISAVLKVFGGLVDLKMTFCIKVDIMTLDRFIIMIVVDIVPPCWRTVP